MLSPDISYVLQMWVRSSGATVNMAALYRMTR